VVDHVSHIVGIGVSVFAMNGAFATLYEVFSRCFFNAPTRFLPECGRLAGFAGAPLYKGVRACEGNGCAPLTCPLT